MKRNKMIAWVLALVLGLATFTACGEKKQEETVTIRVGAMSGPTAMGLVKLMEDAEAGSTKNTYEFAELSTDAAAFTAPLAKGELDIAMVPANLASVLYNNTDGGVQVLAINNLGVLNILERGTTVSDWEDLKGKTLFATGQGAVPEYNLRYLLNVKGIDPDKDLTIRWCADTTEALSLLSETEGSIAMLPQPFATAALKQVEDLRLVFDLNEEFNALNTGVTMVTGVCVVRTEFAKEHPTAVADFLSEYEASMKYTEEHPSEAAALIEKRGIVAKAPIAEAALPGCHLQFIAGSEMKKVLSAYLQILFEQNAKAVGGSLPADAFYYEAK